ncbi:MAG TPA: VWA domain-containing protein [Acidobacteriaceae bacterium]|nr:VWA domain-containing protein [Acidobacteriaceae bacterium]
MTCRRSFALACGIALTCMPLIARAQMGTPAAGQSGASQEQVPEVFRANANLVLVDVVVTDNGSAVHGLKAGDFEVLEDGRAQTVSAFEEHRATDSLKVANAPDVPAHTYSNAPIYSVPSAVNVLLLDALNTPLSDQLYVRRRMIRYLRSVPPGTRIAVFTLGSRLRIVEGFTGDSSVIEKALSEGAGRPEKSPIMDPIFDQQMQLMAWLADSAGANVQAVAAMNQFAADTKSYEADMRIDITIQAMEEIARYLTTIPGRKNLLWFTGSVPITINPDASQTDPTSQMRDYGARVSKLAQLLALARVAVYPIDARGLLNVPSTDAGNNQMNPGILTETMNGRPVATALPTTSEVVQQSDVQFLQENFAEHSLMDQLATGTGGKAFYNTNGVGHALEEAMENGANYYTLGYAPDNRNYNGAFRKIEIRLKEGHGTLQYRQGYYGDDPAQAGKLMPGRLSPLIAAMQHGVLPQSQVLFQVRVLPASDPAVKDEKISAQPAGALAASLKPPLSRYVADYTIDPRGFEFRTLPDGRQHREIELTQVAYDAEGLRLNFTDGGFGIDTAPIEDSGSDWNGKQSIHMHQEIDLPAGKVFLRVGVHDLLSGRIGTLEIPVKVTQP